MIILDDPDETAKNAVVIRSPDPPRPPPPYSPPYSPPQQYSETDPLLGYGIPSNTKADGPTWAVLWFACATCLLGGFVLSLQLGTTQYDPPPISRPPNQPETCVPYYAWGLTPAGKQVNLVMPKSSKRLNVLSSGDLAAGTFTISAEPLVDGDDVMLSVLAATATNSAEPLEYANVCHTIDSEGRYTAVVMAQSQAALYETYQALNLTVVVRLPIDASTPSTPHHYPDISTIMPYFTHTVRSLEGRGRLGHISLNTAGRPVTVDKLFAEEVNIQTSGAAIRGAFDVSRELTLSAEQGRIDIFADLTSSNASTTSANMSLTASNGSITSVVRLHSSSWHGLGGNFNVTAAGTNAPVHLDFTAAPPNSRLIVAATATGGQADVTMHPTFDGRFVVEADQPGKAKLGLRHDVEDPLGEGRKRNESMANVNDQHIAGYVSWGMKNQGAVVVASDESATLIV